MSLTIEQQNAVDILYSRIKSREKLTILAGIAGSGKTYTMRYLLNQLPHRNIVGCSFTGTAAKQLENSSGLNSVTLHNLLYTPIIVRDEVVGFEKKHPQAFENIDLIVLDEHAMTPKKLMEDLLELDIPIIALGDVNQLPAIGESHQYASMFHARLTEPMRQSLNNPILNLAYKALNGELVVNGVYGKDDSVLVANKTELNPKWLHREVQVICGTNKTKDKINDFITGNAHFPATGDRIMFLKNSFKQSITNGTMATVLNCYNRGKFLDMYFRNDGTGQKGRVKTLWRESNPKFNKFITTNCDFQFAATTHKLQGATIDRNCILIDESWAFREHSRNWLYTALTRIAENRKLIWLR